MITVASLAKSYGKQILFEKVSFQLNPGNRYGLVGANGSGKTTFLRMIAGEEEPSEGLIGLPKRLKLGVLRQDHFQFEQVSMLNVVMMGHQELWQAMTEKEELLARADDQFDGDRYAALEDVIAAHDGYSFEARAGEILEGLGIATELHRQPLSSLSGGFKLRVLLGQVLAAEPDCLLLDEPTNHLDILSIRWLEKFLSSYAGCAVVISHDHRFLDNVSTHILDIDYETITHYTGNYSAFVTAKQVERQRKEAEIAKREKKIADHQAYIDRFRAKATKARQAQSKVKQIERIVIDRLAPSSRRYPTFGFKQCRPSGKQVLEVTGLSKAFGDNQVLRDVSLNVRRGDRVAIIGPNGIGKSTLLKILTGKLRADAGRVEWGHETYPGYFAQDHADIFSDSQATVEAWLWDACSGENKGFVRSHLGRVLFSGGEVDKKLKSLSGGESARLIFARMAIEEPNVLVLDEPTNHLDLEAIEALVKGLLQFDGTLILVSHDRWFVSQLATRVVEIGRRQINDFQGTYNEYVSNCGDDHLDVESVELRVRRQKRKRGKAETGAHRDPDQRRREQRIKQLKLRSETLTMGIETAETRIEEINQLFCSPGFFDTTADDKVRKLQEEQQQLTDKVQELMAEWEQVESDLAEE
jgi:ATPase subunit of ABC transporter with duplicated ATPase domains